MTEFNTEQRRQFNEKHTGAVEDLVGEILKGEIIVNSNLSIHLYIHRIRKRVRVIIQVMLRVSKEELVTTWVKS